MHPHVLDDLRGPGRQALRIMAAKLPQSPTAVVEPYYGNDVPVTPLVPRADTVYAEVRTDGAGRLDATEGEILWTLLLGAGTPVCPDVLGAYGPRYSAARLVAAAWLPEEEPPPPADPDDPGLPDVTMTSSAYEALLAVRADEQRARVAALRQAELACDGGDRLDILTGDRSAP
jgi:hypothetical protein